MSAHGFSFATDEDIALFAPGDFALLCPRDQVIATGQDGVIFASDRWTLHSASVSFSEQGVNPGQVVQLSAPASVFRAPGELMIVESVAADRMIVRRRGLAAGVGQPPGPIGGATEIEFTIVTLRPQLERASEGLARRFGLLTGDGGPVEPSAMYPELREVTVLMVLSDLYLSTVVDDGLSQGATAGKGRLLQAELDSRLSRLVLRGSLDGSSGVPACFQTRVSR